MVDASQKIENEDLKTLLKQTEKTNATMSACQFKMHKKDLNDRMNSLAFKMEKVYNLDKRKATADVYRFFKNTFADCLD